MLKFQRRKKSSIMDVAREAGVGTTSVTRFLNPRRRMELSEEFRLRIERAIKKLDYLPSPGARKGRMAKATFTFGVMTSLSKDIFHSRYHTELLSGIFDQIARTSHELKFFLLKDRHYERLEEILHEHGLDGLLILTWRIHPNVVDLVERSSGELPLVIFNDYDPKLKVNILYTDVCEGVHQAVLYLLDQGYRKIAMMRGPTKILFKSGKKTLSVPSIDAQEKAAGFLEALSQRRISFRKKSWMRECPSYREGDGYQAMREWLREKSLPEAVICANDEMALGALRAIKERGLKCPKDIALMGFDDIEKARLVSPALSTVKQPLYQMGQDAVELLIERVQAPGKPFEHKRYLPELVIRETT